VKEFFYLIILVFDIVCLIKPAEQSIKHSSFLLTHKSGHITDTINRF
jgi:hypothetical protein